MKSGEQAAGGCPKCAAAKAAEEASKKSADSADPVRRNTQNDFSYITKSGATANVSNISQDGQKVTFDATFEDARKTAEKNESTQAKK